jgi:hypothetical protein
MYVEDWTTLAGCGAASNFRTLSYGWQSSNPEKEEGRLASGDPSSTYSSSTFGGRLLDLCTGGLSPGRVQIGNLC